MKRVLLFVILVLTLAVTASASAPAPVLTSDGVLYTVAGEPDGTIVVTARYDKSRQTMVVPGTIDGIVDADPQLAYDRLNQTLFVVWRRGASSSDVVFQALSETGDWSLPTVLGNAPGALHRDLHVLLTRTKSLQGENVTLLHAIWWKESAYDLAAEYGLAALSRTNVLSTYVADLQQLAGIRSALETGASNQDGLDAPVDPSLPPLAFTATTDGIDVVFGAKDKKSLTRVIVTPGQPRADARLWIPGGKGATRVPFTKVNSALAGPVETYIASGRVVVYSANTHFRYATLQNGEWTQVRSIPLDAAITPAEIANELRKTVAEEEQQK